MTKETGGPAFPFNHKDKDVDFWYSQEGMTLRDWFAGQAMQGFIAKYGNMDGKATRSYEAADAMLKARGE